MIYGHGDDAFSYGDKVKINFSSNVYSQADYTELKEHLMQHFEVVGHYPEPDAHSLECLLAKQLGIKENTIMVTSGANEAIYLIAQLYKGWASIIPPPTFSEYEDACRMFNHIISYDVKDEFDVLPKDRIYWICNPNNPTGNMLVKGMLNHIVRNHPRYLYVIDQSYADYTLAPMIEPKEMTDVFNLMLIHSLSKTFCIPGLRLGYITAPAAVITRLRANTRPWAVNALAIEAGLWLLSHEDPYERVKMKELLVEAQILANRLRRIFGIHVYHTATNFMLCSLSHGTAAELKEYLIKNHQFLIRDASNFEGLKPCHFRIAAQHPAYNEELVEAIRSFLKMKSEE